MLRSVRRGVDLLSADPLGGAGFTGRRFATVSWPEPAARQPREKTVLEAWPRCKIPAMTLRDPKARSSQPKEQLHFRAGRFMFVA